MNFINFQVPILKEKLREKERQLTDISNSSVMNGGWHQAIAEAKRQYDAIDGALEVALESLLNEFPKINPQKLYFLDSSQHPKHRQGLSRVDKTPTRIRRDKLQHNQHIAIGSFELIKWKFSYS